MQVAQFSFRLPPAEHMAELLPWMQAAMQMIDLLGSYKLKPEQKVGCCFLFEPHPAHLKLS